MHFRRGLAKEEPEINLIPMIDVLLVILIFLMVTTTFTRFAEIKINLPTAEADKPVERANEVQVGVDAQGKYVIDRRPVAFGSVQAFAEELRRAAASLNEPVVIINADANASHQSVINVMEAARLAGLTRITFATQGPQK
ncbi:MAG: biopolymer transporter ExbD [Betaproteobacteria bacterium]|nr:MAG: biopolymer transporter ExbD [Betaproteobacteria bacterium]